MSDRKRENGPDMLRQVRRTLLRYGMVGSGDTVVVGVSGGLDSVSLLDVLTRLQAEYRLNLLVAHVDHGLRRVEGERELHFVEALASRYGVPFEVCRIGPSSYSRGTNIQARARRLRYQFFEEVARKWGAQKIATAHHQDDQTETLLMQLLRGTGGLRGIRPVREGRYIRPLIEIRREEIDAYAGRLDLPFCEDSSNRKRTYLRNRIRQDLIPWIQREVNPSFSEALLHLASILNEDMECLHAMAESALEQATSPTHAEGEVTLRRDLLERMPRAIQRRVLRQAYKRLEGSTRSLSFVHLEGVCVALGTRAGRVHKAFSLPRGIRAFLEYDVLHLSRRDLWQGNPYQYPLCLGEKRPIPEAGILLCARRLPFDPLSAGEAFEKEPSGDPNGGSPSWGTRSRAFLDADLSVGTMVVRNVRPGDRFRPLGLGGEKKLKDFFMDEKIPRSLRHRIPILEIAGRVGWVVGYRIDERFKVSQNTKGVIEVEALAFAGESA